MEGLGYFYLVVDFVRDMNVVALCGGADVCKLCVAMA